MKRHPDGGAARTNQTNCFRSDEIENRGLRLASGRPRLVGHPFAKHLCHTP